MALGETEQFPNVRAMLVCPSCWKGKRAGQLVCWDCNAELKAKHDGTYGQKVIERIERMNTLNVSINTIGHSAACEARNAAMAE